MGEGLLSSNMCYSSHKKLRYRVSLSMNHLLCLKQSYRPFSYFTKAWIERYFYTILYARFDRVALELRSQLCTFENSTNCNEISFDPHSLSE